MRFRKLTLTLSSWLLTIAVTSGQEAPSSPFVGAEPVNTASQVRELPQVSEPAEVIGPDWEGTPGATQPATTLDVSIALPADGDIESLRRELREAVGQLGAARQELSQTRQQLLEQQPAPNGDHVKRLSSLETGFDAFRKQLSKEAGGTFPTAKLTGFTQLDDYANYQDAKNIATVGQSQNGVGFRRARLAVLGNVSEFTAYQLEVDFATAGRPSFFDVFVEQSNLPVFGAVRAGQFLQPFSVDAMSGFRNLPFLERSLPFLAFVPFRRVGIMSSNFTVDERTYLAYSVFKTGGFNNAPLGDSRFATDLGNQGGYSFSGRLTHLLWYDEPSQDRYLWHVGASYDFSQITATTTAAPYYQSRTGPEFGPIGDAIDTSVVGFGPGAYIPANATPPSFIDTGRYQASGFNLMGVESVFQYGSVSFQTELMWTEVNSVVGPIWYRGGYAELMWRPTGEHRGYDKRLASLKNPVPFTNFISFRRGGIQGWGAWELAGRLSCVDLRNPQSLNGHYLSGTNNSGNGTLTDTTLGVTWFLNAHTKMQLNWIHAFLDNTSTVAHTTSGFSQANFLASRVQVDF